MINELYATKEDAFEAGKLVGLHLRMELEPSELAIRELRLPTYTQLHQRVKALEAVLVAFIQTSETGIAAKIIDGAPSLEPFRQYLRAKP